MYAFFRRRGSERDLFGDRQAVTFQRDYFFRMVGQDAQALESQIDQYLRADAALVLQQALPSDIHVKLFARMVLDARERAWRWRGAVDAEASPRVVKVN